jgi:GTP-binding protein EngB required for normal cell division
MKIQYLQILYKLCLIITGTSAVNLSMNTYFIRQLLKKEFQKFSQLQTVDEMMKIPQSPAINQYDGQLQEYLSKIRTNFAIVNDKAYWVKNNNVYESVVRSDGTIDIKNAKAIDVFSLSEKEMKSLLKIIDSLK